MRNKPLSGKSVLITRAKDQSSTFAKWLKKFGAEVIEFPTIEIVPPSNWKKVDQALDKLSQFHWIIFTSANGVKFFFERVREKKKRFPSLLRVCAIGPATAKALKKRGIRIDFIPKEFIAESILKGFEKKNIKGKRIIIARAKKARDVLPKELRNMGAEVEVVETYQTINPKGGKTRLKNILKNQRIDVIAFTSSSTVNHFIKMLKGENIKRLLKNIFIACIGPITAKTAKDLGLQVHIQPDEFTIPSLTHAIAKFFDSHLDQKAGA
jgi:uroporphyrinogen III methyltransferase/synthase